MRPLTSHFPATALPTLATVRKQPKAARVFRRAPAVRAVVAGHHVTAVSATCHFTHAALRQWVQRFATQGAQGLVERPRSGRPRQVTGEIEQHLHRLVAQAPLQHGSIYAQWRCRELATVLVQLTGVQRGRGRVRWLLKKTREAPAGLLGGSIPTPLPSRLPLSNVLPANTARVAGHSSCARKRKPSCGAVPCPGRAGGVAPSAIACRHAP
jgi:putative transposase